MSEDEFEDVIDGVYDSVVVCGIEFTPGQILRRLDPIAFREAYLDYLDGEEIDLDDMYLGETE